MNQSPPPAPAAPAPHAHSRLRLLVAVCGTALLVLTSLAYWIDHTLLDSDEFTARVDVVLRQPETSQRVGDVLATQLIDSGAIQQELASLLPPRAAAAPYLLQDDLHEVIAHVLARIMSSDFAIDRTKAAVQQVHSTVVSTLEGRRTRLQVQNDGLVLDLSDVVGPRLTQLATAAGAPPQSDGYKVVLVDNAENLTRASRLVQALDGSATILGIASVLVFAVAVVLSKPKWGGVVTVGHCVIISGIISLLLWLLAVLSMRSLLDTQPVTVSLSESLLSNYRFGAVVLIAVGGVMTLVAEAVSRGWVRQLPQSVGSEVSAVGPGKLIFGGAVALIVLAFAF